MKFYLAAQFSQKDAIEVHRQDLISRGYAVTSTWTTEEAAPNCSLRDFDTSYHRQMANRDLQEIDAADCLILFSVDPDEKTRRGGRHVEFGYALGRRKQLVVIGPRENIFHHIGPVVVFGTWKEFVEQLTTENTALQNIFD